ncbi:MAG: exosortase/archaeosortase family protein, partial [Planctomycetota bacterium]
LLGGWPVMRIAWFPIAFLVLAIPLPYTIYVGITMSLQRIAASISAAVLPLVIPGLHTEAQAVVIDYVLPGMAPGQLNVEEACSGMRSTMAFVALGVAVAYVYDRPFWQRLILVLSCVPIAIACNAIRVTITGILHIRGYEELARGTAHQILGLLMFGVALGLFSLLSYVLAHLWVEVPEEHA